MWNAAYTEGGPVCTLAQLEANTDVYVDHFVVVDFNGFGDMVDAVGGVPVCVPEDIVDREHRHLRPGGRPVGPHRRPGPRLRARPVVGELEQQNDISRIRRQQTFIAALVREVKSAGTLTRPDKVVSFLDAATQSLTTDDELGLGHPHGPDRHAAAERRARQDQVRHAADGVLLVGLRVPRQGLLDA